MCHLLWSCHLVGAFPGLVLTTTDWAGQMQTVWHSTGTHWIHPLPLFSPKTKHTTVETLTVVLCLVKLDVSR